MGGFGPFSKQQKLMTRKAAAKRRESDERERERERDAVFSGKGEGEKGRPKIPSLLYPSHEPFL